MEEKEVQGATVHKRRVRYSGTHPKRFEEKYKEQNPIMLTSDNGLQLKSKLLGITTISLKKFLKNNLR